MGLLCSAVSCVSGGKWMLTESSCVFARAAPRAAKDKLGPPPSHTSPCRKVSSSEIPLQTLLLPVSLILELARQKELEIRSRFASTLTRSVFSKGGLKPNNHQVGLNLFQGLGCQPESLYFPHTGFFVCYFFQG